MLAFLYRLAWDEAAFARYAKAIIGGLASAMLAGGIIWPSFVPPAAIALMTALAHLIPTGEKNGKVEERIRQLEAALSRQGVEVSAPAGDPPIK